MLDHGAFFSHILNILQVDKHFGFLQADFIAGPLQEWMPSKASHCRDTSGRYCQGMGHLVVEGASDALQPPTNQNTASCLGCQVNLGTCGVSVGRCFLGSRKWKSQARRQLRQTPSAQSESHTEGGGGTTNLDSSSLDVTKRLPTTFSLGSVKGSGLGA